MHIDSITLRSYNKYTLHFKDALKEQMYFVNGRLYWRLQVLLFNVEQ